ncbi:MAG: class I SAM-dependent methyltransferase, partial [Actinomycetota bacterium]|nr:class I SAM-dependent methyltransferase [Actinomycetota bacterium]
SELQSEHGVTGDILEIGVYRGKSAVLLGYLRRERERLVLCDPFKQPDTPTGAAPTRSAAADEFVWYPEVTRDEFLTTYGRYHAQPPVLYQCPSSELATHENVRTFRLIHIDGSHAYENVRSDIGLASRMLLPQGLVILDDYRSFHTPGASAAIWEAVVNDGLCPLWFTPDKMYASWGLDIGDVRKPLQRLFRQILGVEAVYETVRGHEVLIALPRDYGQVRASNKDRLLTALLPPALANLPRHLRSLDQLWRHAEP